MSENKKIAVVRIRGLVNIRKTIGATLDMLRLYRKNYCAVVPDTAVYKGMVSKVKSYITYGTIDNETEKLLEKRKQGDNKFYRLNSPKKGYGRKGIKVAFSNGGALGDRKEKINDLIKRMI